MPKKSKGFSEEVLEALRASNILITPHTSLREDLLKLDSSKFFELLDFYDNGLRPHGKANHNTIYTNLKLITT